MGRVLARLQEDQSPHDRDYQPFFLLLGEYPKSARLGDEEEMTAPTGRVLVCPEPRHSALSSVSREASALTVQGGGLALPALCDVEMGRRNTIHTGLLS